MLLLGPARVKNQVRKPAEALFTTNYAYNQVVAFILCIELGTLCALTQSHSLFLFLSLALEKRIEKAKSFSFLTPPLHIQSPQ